MLVLDSLPRPEDIELAEVASPSVLFDLGAGGGTLVASSCPPKSSSLRLLLEWDRRRSGRPLLARLSSVIFAVGSDNRELRAAVSDNIGPLATVSGLIGLLVGVSETIGPLAALSVEIEHLATVSGLNGPKIDGSEPLAAVFDEIEPLADVCDNTGPLVTELGVSKSKPFCGFCV